MQNTIIAIVLALVVLGGGYYYFMGQTAPAPTEETATETTTETGMPVPEAGNEGTVEMEVSSSTTSTETGAPAATTTAATSAAAAKTFTIEGSKMKFVPATMKVKKGDTVKVTFKNVDGFHDFVIDEFKVKTKQFNSPGEEVVEFVADKAGTFEYYCSVGEHRKMGMKGTLTVE